MDLITPDGEKLEGSKTRDEVLDVLEKLAPKNKEQERILAKAIGEQLERNRRKKMNIGLKEGFEGVFKTADNVRKKTDGFSESRNWRLEAIIPNEMYYVAKKIWGDDVITNPQKFKEAFIEDEQGKLCLTVDPKTL